MVAVLAAGQSRRFGKADKLTAKFRGKPMIAHACDTLRTFPFLRRFTVLSPDNLIEVEGFESVLNASCHNGLSTSVAVAAGRAQESGAAALLIALGDMPLVPQSHFAALIEHAAINKIIATRSDQTALPPVAFGRNHFSQLMQLLGDDGAHALLAGAHTIACDPDLLIDIDTPQTLAQMQM